MKFKSVVGEIKLPAKRRRHIILHHPIMEDYLDKLREVLKRPKEIRYSSYSDETLLFYRYFDNIEEGKYIVVVINSIEKEVLTAYLSNRIKTGRKYDEK